MLWELWARLMSWVAEARVSFLYPEVSQSLGWFGVCTGTVSGTDPTCLTSGSGAWCEQSVFAAAQGLAQRESWQPADSVCSPG